MFSVSPSLKCKTAKSIVEDSSEAMSTLPFHLEAKDISIGAGSLGFMMLAPSNCPLSHRQTRKNCEYTTFGDGAALETLSLAKQTSPAIQLDYSLRLAFGDIL